MDSDEVKNLARSFGADLIGIASIERFRGVPLQLHPSSILPECRSIIVVGYQVVRGALRGVEDGLLFSGYDFGMIPIGDYERFARVHVEDVVLATVVYELTCAIENEGWEAVPVFPYPPEAWPQGVGVALSRVPPNVHPDPEYAAVAAGLGEIGYGNFLLTPDFGPRQRLQLILTELPLKPDPIFEGKLCDQCMKCVEICPLGAISNDKRVDVNVAGKSMQVAVVNYAVCNKCPNGARPNELHEAGKPDRLAALCTRTCIAHLEERNILKRKFRSPFRRRSPKIFDLDGKLVMRGE